MYDFDLLKSVSYQKRICLFQHKAKVRKQLENPLNPSTTTYIHVHYHNNVKWNL